MPTGKFRPRPEKSDARPRRDGAASGARTSKRGRLGPTAAKCTDPKQRAHLLRYVLARATDDESLDVEAHLLGCEMCFQDLKALYRAGTVVTELSRLGSQPPKPPKSR